MYKHILGGREASHHAEQSSGGVLAVIVYRQRLAARSLNRTWKSARAGLDLKKKVHEIGNSLCQAWVSRFVLDAPNQSPSDFKFYFYIFFPQ